MNKKDLRNHLRLTSIADQVFAECGYGKKAERCLIKKIKSDEELSGHSLREYLDWLLRFHHVVNAITNHNTGHPWLSWNPFGMTGSVRVLTDRVFPTEQLTEETMTGKRGMFLEELTEELQRRGWVRCMEDGFASAAVQARFLALIIANGLPNEKTVREAYSEEQLGDFWERTRKEVGAENN